MAEPLKIRFATDHSAAKAGMQDLAASVVSNMVKVSDALGAAAEANGGLGATVRKVAGNIVGDVTAIGKAGLQAANDSNYSAVATAVAMSKAAAASQTGSVALKGSWAVASESAKFHYGIIRNEAAATTKMLVESPIGFGLGLVAGILAIKLAYDGVAAAARAASEALEGTAKVGTEAANLGVSTTFLQTYRAQARSLKVDVEDLTKSLQMSRDAFAMKLGEGGQDARNDSAFGARLRQQQKGGNVTGDQVARFDAASGTEAKFRAALDIMAELQSKGRDLAALDLAGKLFPPELVERIRTGAIDIDRLRKTIDDVKNPNLVLLSPEEIVRAQELQRRLDDAQATLDKAGKDFRHELALAGEGLKQDAIAWQELMAKGATFAVSMLKQARQYVETEEANRPAIYGRDYWREEDKPKSGLAKDVGKPSALPSTGDADRDAALNLLRGNLGNRTLIDQAQSASRSMTDALRRSGSPLGDKSKPIISGSKSGTDSFDAVETYINGLEKTAAAAKAETEAFGKSNAEKASAIALARLKETADQQGITLTEQQIAQTRAAAEATSAYKDKLADLEQQERQTAETARYFGNALASSIGDALLEGKSLSNVLLDIEKMLARGAIQALLTGQGPLASFLGTAPSASAGGNAVGGITGFITSMFRANGGPVSAGQAYTVGEMGQEIFVPNQDGRMVPIARGGFGAGGMGNGPSVQIIDQRSMSAAAPVLKSGPDGSTQILLRDLEGGLAGRGARGQGSLSPLLNTPATRRG